MIEILQTDAFTAWIADLRNQKARAAVLGRIGRLKLGNPGDVEPVGEGVSQIRFGKKLIVLLGGGDKSTQDRDIEAAKTFAAELED